MNPQEILERDLTPRQIVEALDKHIVGQAGAKHVVAIALRNRLRRKRLPRPCARKSRPRTSS